MNESLLRGRLQVRILPGSPKKIKAATVLLDIRHAPRKSDSS